MSEIFTNIMQTQRKYFTQTEEEKPIGDIPCTKKHKFNNIRTLFQNEACADGNLNKSSSNVGITDQDITVHKRTFQGVKWSVTVKNQDLLLTFAIMSAFNSNACFQERMNTYAKRKS